MSHDLFFTSPEISLEEFNVYFKDRPFYELRDGQASYLNEGTDVNFYFDHNNEPPTQEDDITYSVAFNMNYCRPHYFGLEAELEVQNFVNHFGSKIYDDQAEGMKEDHYTKDGFLNSWNYGNKFGYKIVSDHMEENNLFFKPTDELEKIWLWNFNKDKQYDDIGEDIFIPNIFL